MYEYYKYFKESISYKTDNILKYQNVSNKHNYLQLIAIIIQEFII